VEHNPRVIDMAELAHAMRAMEDFDPTEVAAAEYVAAHGRRAIRLDAIGHDDAAILHTEAGEIGVSIFGGPVGAAVSPRIIAADDETFERLSAKLSTRGAKTLAAAIVQALAAYRRTSFVLPFADGAHIDLSAGTLVMGILNVTPDSFSDGGKLLTPAAAVEEAKRMVDEGADLLDVGGESTRPGAAPIPADEEARRVVPAIEAIKRAVPVRVSVDTSKHAVARNAILAGADLVNDVSALSDPAMTGVLKETRVPVIVMHRRGTPQTMQQDTHYVDLLSSVVGFLRKCVARAVAAGIADDKILVDPGLGFGKSPAGNLRIVRELPTLRSVGRPIVLGASRKSFIGTALDVPLQERLEGSVAVAACAAWQGAHIIRAHDVAATKRATRMIDAIRKS
jgi:dihydropteroate synthase